MHCCHLEYIHETKSTSNLVVLNKHQVYNVSYRGAHTYGEPTLYQIYAEVNLVTALVPSETACLASSPGRTKRTAV
jgi:hypothetical protein